MIDARPPSKPTKFTTLLTRLHGTWPPKAIPVPTGQPQPCQSRCAVSCQIWGDAVDSPIPPPNAPPELKAQPLQLPHVSIVPTRRLSKPSTSAGEVTTANRSPLNSAATPARSAATCAAGYQFHCEIY